MARTLNGIDFPINARWINQDSWHGVAQAVQPTLGGALIIYANQSFAQEIEIDVAEFSFTDGVYRSEILELARQVGGTFPFVWDDFIRTVVFSHHDVPVEFVPLIPTRDHGDPKQRFSVRLRLLVVN